MLARVLVGTLLVLAVGHSMPDTEKAKPNPFDLIQCDSKPGDKDLALAQIVDEGHYLGKVGIEFIYPPEGAVQHNVINCIIVKDMKPELGSTVSITSGKIGETNVTIQMTSAFAKGVSYSIQLMGQPAKD